MISGKQVPAPDTHAHSLHLVTSLTLLSDEFLERAMTSAANCFYWGVVQHYVADAGFGFLRNETDPDEINNVYFSITSCDVQTPPPRVGERVLFSRDGNSKQATVAAVRRVNPTAVAMLPVPDSRPSRPNLATKGTVIRRMEPTQTPRETPRPTRGNRRQNAEAAEALQRAVYVKQQMLAEVPTLYEGGKHPRYVYVDLDNVWVSFVRAEHIVDRYPGVTSTRQLILDLEGLTRRLVGETRGCVVRLVAFYFNTPETIATQLRQVTHGDFAWDIRKQETTSDTTMQLELLTSKRPCTAHPKTLVLVTGDGNIAPNGMCFREIMDLYLRDGWFVEVHAWLSSMARSYIEFQREYPSTVVIRPFDDDDVGEIVSTRRNFAAQTTKRQPRKPDVVQRAPFNEMTQEEQTAALVEVFQARAAQRVSPASARHPRDIIDQEKMTILPRTFRAEQYAEIIRRLEGRDGELYVPAGLRMLVQSRVIQESSSIHEADSASQLLLLTTVLYEEMDVAMRRELQVPHGSF